MATTKIWSIRDSLSRVVDYAENLDKTANPDYTEPELQGLYDVMNYAVNDKKTERQFYVSGVSCVPEMARQQMIMTKQQYGKEGGIVAFHAYQSFMPGELTPNEAHQIGVELANRLWGDRFQVVVATHLNTKCLHNHFVINSVSFLDGKRYNDCKKTYLVFRNLSDQICLGHSKSIIENPNPTRTPRSIYFAEKANKITMYNIMREDIDSAIKQSMTRSQFGAALRAMGYELNFDVKRKYPTIKMPGAKHPTRLNTLGENYTKKAIDNRILSHCRREFPIPSYEPSRKVYMFLGSFISMRKITGLRALYLYYCYRLGVLPKDKPRYKPQHPALKLELIRLREYTAQTRLLWKYKIDTQEQINKFIFETEEKIKLLISARNKIYNKLRRCNDPEEIRKLKSNRDGISEQIASLRSELKSAKGVLARSDKVKETLKIEIDLQHGKCSKTQSKNMNKRNNTDLNGLAFS